LQGVDGVFRMTDEGEFQLHVVSISQMGSAALCGTAQRVCVHTGERPRAVLAMRAFELRCTGLNSGCDIGPASVALAGDSSARIRTLEHVMRVGDERREGRWRGRMGNVALCLGLAYLCALIVMAATVAVLSLTQKDTARILDADVRR